MFCISGDICPGFQSQGESLACMLLCLPVRNGIPQFHFWCDTYWPLDSQHGSRDFLSTYLHTYISQEHWKRIISLASESFWNSFCEVSVNINFTFKRVFLFLSLSSLSLLFIIKASISSFFEMKRSAGCSRNLVSHYVIKYFRNWEIHSTQGENEKENFTRNEILPTWGQIEHRKTWKTQNSSFLMFGLFWPRVGWNLIQRVTKWNSPLLDFSLIYVQFKLKLCTTRLCAFDNTFFPEATHCLYLASLLLTYIAIFIPWSLLWGLNTETKAQILMQMGFYSLSLFKVYHLFVYCNFCLATFGLSWIRGTFYT